LRLLCSNATQPFEINLVKVFYSFSKQSINTLKTLPALHTCDKYIKMDWMLLSRKIKKAGRYNLHDYLLVVSIFILYLANLKKD